MTQARLLFALLLIFPISGVSARDGAQAKTSAAQELQRLELPDAEQYALGLYNDVDEWNSVSSRIASGQRDWLQVARSLSRYADGGFAEELLSDLGTALVKQPSNVLALLTQSDESRNHDFEVSRVCSAPFPAPGKKWLRRYQKSAIRSVESVHDVKLQRLRGDCIETLHSIDFSLPADAYD